MKKKNKKPAPPSNHPLALARRSSSALKRAGERAAYQYVCGTGRGSNNQTVKSYAWSEGFRIQIDEGRVLVSFKMDFDWQTAAQPKIRRKTEVFAKVLTAAGLRCFITEAGNINVIGVVEKIEPESAAESIDFPLWNGR